MKFQSYNLANFKEHLSAIVVVINNFSVCPQSEVTELFSFIRYR